jgi:bifunctional non-homologous end joining protein LigD
VPARKRDRVLFPESGFSKGDVFEYYRAAAPFLLPHLRNRPLSFKRYPDTIHNESFWEKDAPSFTPAWVRRVPVARRGGEAPIEYVMANDVRTLTWIAEVGGVELHPFLHRAPKLEQPTDVVFDLDPGEGAGILHCCRVAVILREALAALDLRSFVKVSGSKGLQVYAPLNTPVTHDQTESFAQLLAMRLERTEPKLIVARMTKALRLRRVFIDWSQNADYKTTVAVYSLRSKSAQPWVSMPVRWSEIEKATRPAALYFEPAAALKRMRNAGDLWHDMRKIRQRLPGASGRSVTRRVAPSRKAEEEAFVVNGVRLPRPRSQSGRRLFALAKTENGNELWLDMHSKFKRWILRQDREGGPRLVALPAGDFTIDRSYFRGEVPREWRNRVSLEDTGTYEVIEGSYQQRRFDLFFIGRVLSGRWLLEKVSDDDARRSWALQPRSR